MATKRVQMETRFDLSLLIGRLVTGTVVLAHGMQKLFGWFGGYGFDGTMQFFTESIGLPYIGGVAIIAIETLGMLMLIMGLFSRAFSAATIVIMVGAISFHATNGFFMDWGNALQGEGYEFHVVVVALATVTLLNGGGRYSLDQLLKPFALYKTSIKGT